MAPYLHRIYIIEAWQPHATNAARKSFLHSATPYWKEVFGRYGDKVLCCGALGRLHLHNLLVRPFILVGYFVIPLPRSSSLSWTSFLKGHPARGCTFGKRGCPTWACCPLTTRVGRGSGCVRFD